MTGRRSVQGVDIRCIAHSASAAKQRPWQSTAVRSVNVFSTILRFGTMFLGITCACRPQQSML